MKIKKLSIIISLLAFISCFFLIVFSTNAQYQIEVSLPNAPAGSTVPLNTYIQYIYQGALALVGVAALGSLVVGGLMYMLSDTVTTKDKAKEYIWSAISGLILALAAWLILNTINPELIQLRMPAIQGLPAQPGNQGAQPGNQGAQPGNQGAQPSATNPDPTYEDWGVLNPGQYE